MQAPDKASDAAEVFVEMDDGATISARRYGAGAPERVVISHGNGLAIDAFARFRDALVARGFEVVAFDMRNHGHNPVHPVQGKNWPRFLSDFPQILAGIERNFGPKPSHGAFHSLSSAVCLLSQSVAPYDWRSLTAFEPPLPSVPGSALHASFQTYHEALSERAARRRASFTSPDELATSIRRSSLFARVPEADIALLARATLRGDGQRGYQLCCPPAFEAATFLLEGVDGLRSGLAKIDCPVRIVAGDERIHYATILVQAGRELARDFGFEILELNDATHFMQLEKPETCARLVAGGPPVAEDLRPDLPQVQAGGKDTTIDDTTTG